MALFSRQINQRQRKRVKDVFMPEHPLASTVLIGVPTSSGCRLATETWLLVQAQRSFRVIYGMGSLSVEDSRTAIVAKFLAQKDFTHLLFIDSDVAPPMNLIEKLYAHDKAVMAGNYPLYIDGRIIASGYGFDKEKQSYKPLSFLANGMQRVYAIGLGCVLIRKEVLQKAVNYPCFQMRYGHDSKGHFKMLDSEDITFSKVLTTLGFKIYMDFDQRCDHYKVLSLGGIIQDVQGGKLIYESPK